MNLFRIVKLAGALVGGVAVYKLIELVLHEGEEKVAAAYTPIPMKPSEPAFTNGDPASVAENSISFTFELPTTIDPSTQQDYTTFGYGVQLSEDQRTYFFTPHRIPWIVRIEKDSVVRRGENVVRVVYNSSTTPRGRNRLLLTVYVTVSGERYGGAAIGILNNGA